MPPIAQTPSPTAFTMFTIGAWGHRFFESDHDYDIVDELTNDAGFGGKENGKPQSTSQWLLRPKNPDEVRHYMNNGGVVDVFNIYYDMLQNYTPVNLKTQAIHGDLLDSPRYYLMILGMLAIQHGWTLQRRFRRWLQSNYTKMGLNKERTLQAKKALSEFENGIPCDLGSQSLREMQLEVMLMSNAERTTRGIVDNSVCVINTIYIRSKSRMLHDNKIARILGATTTNGVNILRLGKDGVLDGKVGEIDESSTAGPHCVPVWRADLKKQNKPMSMNFYTYDSVLGI